ncbi:uncharacterized protein LOC110224176 [Arabidopsis lyrata subsp. lyrata]|uniref:uncharacterized protein LOC110224176 n=1 Tax=Arabidopsis lyrata subsp. lyrata TaxID=81972 RepID=UPI000A29DB4F|nr:uncharacterized protein LOC110224176 [Arabidopsis lyrata subsp. lyrata]|eukprot:XP_020865622.1 uncharacterized protein LOC110224176 [Arabidopsis lyrata subsp. lyrata]
MINAVKVFNEMLKRDFREIYFHLKCVRYKGLVLFHHDPQRTEITKNLKLLNQGYTVTSFDKHVALSSLKGSLFPLKR